ncbi:Protein SLOW GREEN 1 chloroplastic-like [Quillaja saponaria]|uniref:Protein SLOW GREEN 1 chloroplastic-like n=1 Tax=Quillaja saponaria TaxID=32244 RepID=A0AAD7Q0F0_QUISA|nr:Protein SLOW GREEN 1 chloroplastic-like [Quillaja saponaria]
MASLAKVHHRHQPLHLSLNHHRSSFAGPIYSVSFRTLPPRSSSRQPSSFSLRLSAIRALSSSSSSSSSPDSKHQPFLTLSSHFASIVRTASISIAAAAFFFMRLQHNPVIASPGAPSTVESTEESTENISLEEKERIIEEQLSNNPNDAEALRSLMEVRVRAHKLGEAIQVIDRLIELEPDEFEWPLLKAHMYIYIGDLEQAKNGFEEILTRDPYCVEAFHGLVMATSETNGSVKDLVDRIEEAIESCKKHKNKSEVRDFKLLIAQVQVMEGDHFDALKIYEELVKEDPRDFRPYLCQGIIYTLLRKKEEAEKQFQMFRRLVPKNHPYKEYFEENMFATKFFSQKVEMERAGSKS